MIDPGRIPVVRCAWHPSYRLIPSRYPTVALYDAIADPADLEVVFAIEALTNARIRDELGDLQLVAPEERVSGAGSTPVMAAFTHLNPDGSRFSDGSYGVYYAAQIVQVGIDGCGDQAQVDIDRRLLGAREEHGAVVAHLRDRRVEVLCRVVDAVAAVGEPRAVRVQVRERGHHRGAARPGHALLGRHQLQVAELVADPGIGQRLDREHDLQIRRVGDRVVQRYRRVARWDQPVRRMPRAADDRYAVGLDQALPPRCASR